MGYNKTRKAGVKGKTLRNRPKKTVKVTTTVPVKPMKTTQKASVMDLVKRIVHSGRENKSVGRRVWNAKAITPGITAGDSVLPEIANGDASCQREGDRVQPRWLGVRGTIAVKYDKNDRTDTINARVMIVRIKQSDKNTESLAAFAANANKLLRTNFALGNTVAGYTGAVLNNEYPINTDLFRVLYDKVFTLAPATYVAGQQQPSNFGSVVHFSTKLPLPVGLSYDDTDNQAQNYAPIILVGYCYPDGRPLVPDEQMLIADAYSRLIYEDA